MAIILNITKTLPYRRVIVVVELFCFDSCSSFIITAMHAYPVGQLCLMTLRTGNQTRYSQFPVCSTFMLSRLGRSPLGNRHAYTSSYYSSRSFLRSANLWSISSSEQAHSFSFRFLPQVGQSPLQASRQSGFNGKLIMYISLTSSVTSNSD